MKKLAMAILLLLAVNISFAQTLDELKAQKKLKKDSIAAIQSNLKAVQSKIDAWPGWKKGAFGTIGVSLSGFSSWYSKGTPNSNAGNIGVTLNGYANLTKETFFWRNAANINLSWVRIDDRDIDTDDNSFQAASDVFNISSLYGQKLSSKFAISALAEYRTTIIDNFNDPGYLDTGVGATWTPIPDLVVVVHPLNYNFVFSSGETIFESSLGAKIVADYSRKLGNINFKTNLSMFQSYKSSDFSNWTWTNGFGYTLWKVVGVGFDFGLRSNKQEALSYAIANAGATDPVPTFGTVDNKLQSYWLIGLNYSL
ncbi:DUF3078 domain-containing protein [Arenibacter sp. 6A1]|uniref:DUF3078 domain-containing protein n=1 Tax=Arenibacter sp. 6A1 TaxID=2720391 RepID=UPI001447CD4C|nr:DUF3078 domain-containing protein [Arenibacter sp. 6A1]NKI26760.1 DUF3078 domain-containing protein [Arenibacter sp. 6A1]